MGRNKYFLKLLNSSIGLFFGLHEVSGFLLRKILLTKRSHKKRYKLNNYTAYVSWLPHRRVSGFPGQLSEQSTSVTETYFTEMENED